MLEITFDLLFDGFCGCCHVVAFEVVDNEIGYFLMFEDGHNSKSIMIIGLT